MLSVLIRWTGRRTARHFVWASAAELQQARSEVAAKGGRLGAQITKLGLLEESQLTDFVAKQYGVPAIDLDDFERACDLVLALVGQASE